MIEALNRDRHEIERFLATPLAKHLASLSSADWDTDLVDYASRTLAYVEFLRDRGLTPSDLRDRNPEATAKPNYINRYPLVDRCLDGDLSKAYFMAVSSGTTGKAAIWPRSEADEIRSSFAVEQIFVESFQADTRRTLALVCFPLGIWIGGMYTASVARMLSAKGYPVTTLTPGTNMGEIRRCLSEVAPQFDQTILCGYPPFLRDVVDELVPNEIDPALIRMKMLLAGEPISESWRDDLCRKLAADNPLTDVISMYGTADAGIVGFETEHTIRMRRRLSGSPELSQAAFSTSGLPSIFQYQPYKLHVEENAGHVLLTVQSMHPLFRYSIGDSGTGMTYADLSSRIDGQAEAGLPVVVLHGRTDHTVSFFGGNIYPEHVSALMDHSDWRSEITGRFTMLVQHSAEGNRPLTVVVELQPGAEASHLLANRLAEALEAHLLAVNSEYANYVPKRYQRPEIVCRPHRDEEFFARGKKQVYVKRD